MDDNRPTIILVRRPQQQSSGGLSTILLIIVLLVVAYRTFKGTESNVFVREVYVTATPYDIVVPRPNGLDDVLDQQVTTPEGTIPASTQQPAPQMSGDCTNSPVNTPGTLLPRDQIVLKVGNQYQRVIDFTPYGVGGYNVVTEWQHVYEHYDEIVARAGEGCYNPAFVMTWYIEETGAGNCARFGNDTKDLGIVNRVDGTKANPCDWRDQFEQFLLKYKQYASVGGNIGACRGSDGLSLREWLLLYGPGPGFCDQVDPDDGVMGSFDGMNFQNRGSAIYKALTGGTGALDFSRK